MSKQLSISAALSVLALAAFALFAVPAAGLDAPTPDAQTVASASGSGPAGISRL